MQELLTTKVNSPSVFKKNLLLIGSCLNLDHPNFIKEVSKNRVILYTCLEKNHMNTIESKYDSPVIYLLLNLTPTLLHP